MNHLPYCRELRGIGPCNCGDAAEFLVPRDPKPHYRFNALWNYWIIVLPHDYRKFGIVLWPADTSGEHCDEPWYCTVCQTRMGR